MTRAWVLPRHEGRGTVAVTFAMDAADGPIPDLVRTVPEVKAHLEAVAPATASVSVQAPRPKELHLVLELTPSTEEVRHQVEQEVADLLLRKATPKGYYDGDGRLMDGTVRESDLHAAISSAPLELAHRIISPAGDVSVENIGDIIVLGSIRCA